MQTQLVEHVSESAALPWFAAYAKHQHEKRAAELLARKGIEVFLPLYREVRRWTDRQMPVSLPVFPCYLFVRANLEQKMDILKTPGIFYLVESEGRACPIPESEIAAIQVLVKHFPSVRPHPFLKAGDRIRISRGAMAGMEGILIRVKNQHRVVISLDLLQKSLSAEVDLSTLEASTSLPLRPPVAVSQMQLC
jgi:transcription antitermination factor NusG